MDTISVFFTSHLFEIYFIYGLAFFLLGVVVWLEASRSSALPSARPLPFLAAFGLIHGSHEWIEMLRLRSSSPPALLARGFRLLVLAVSFFLLIEFGLRLLALDDHRKGRQIVRWLLPVLFLGGMTLVWTTWDGEEAWAAADAWCRYSLAVPGALVAALGLYRQSRRLKRRQVPISRDLLVAGLGMLLYGIPGQLFVGRNPFALAAALNSEVFAQAFHFPVQLLRTLTAVLMAVGIVRALRLFEVGRQQRMQELDRARAEAQQRLNRQMAEREALQRQLFRQVVWTEEEERQYIARELHDEAGQAMTALSWGLATVEDTLLENPERAHRQIEDLQRLTEQVSTELRQLTGRLRPTVLDELGLVAALFAYADECSARFPFTVDIDVAGRRRRLLSEIETTLYRTAQEAVTNVVKHAQASHVNIQLAFGDQEVTLAVSDDGAGMDVDIAQRAAVYGRGFGLAGIRERVRLVGGDLEMQSTPGTGTSLSIRVPLSEDEVREHDPTVVGG